MSIARYGRVFDSCVGNGSIWRWDRAQVHTTRRSLARIRAPYMETTATRLYDEKTLRPAGGRGTELQRRTRFRRRATARGRRTPIQNAQRLGSVGAYGGQTLQDDPLVDFSALSHEREWLHSGMFAAMHV